VDKSLEVELGKFDLFDSLVVVEFDSLVVVEFDSLRIVDIVGDNNSYYILDDEQHM
jgi:hypothetical protein